jgi:NAD+ synthase
MSLADKIIEWIRAQVKEAQAEGVVVGLSGGVDSSTVAVLSKKAMGENMLGLILPCESSREDEELALLLAEKFGIRTEKVVLDEVYHTLLRTLPEGGQVARANIKPRLRMLTLYYFANNLNYIVAGTGNRSEIMVGYFTKYGDGGVDILPLGGLFKSQVRELAKELNIPDVIIERMPSAGLWSGQTDEGEMGISYDMLEDALVAIQKGERASSSIMERVEKMVKSSEHKRRTPPMFFPK